MKDALLIHLGSVCSAARQSAQPKPRKGRLMELAGWESETALWRFETGKNWPRVPRNETYPMGGADRVVGAYAELTGISSLDLWRTAVARAEASRRENRTTKQINAAMVRAVEEGLRAATTIPKARRGEPPQGAQDGRHTPPRQND